MSERDPLYRLAGDQRLACQQVSRRVRYEGSREVPPHWVPVLSALREAPRGPGELASLERVSKPSMTRTLRCLSEAGLVRFDDHPSDGRQKRVSLTEDGRELIERTRRDRDDFMVRFVEGLDPEQQALLRGATDLLVELMRR